LSEFDLDAALLRHPSLILVDELAHSNVQGAAPSEALAGCRRAVAAGIDVFTTLECAALGKPQRCRRRHHQCAGMETVPDTAFDDADEVVLVVFRRRIARTAEGWKSVPARQAERAANNFFRKGNLMALRELALRRTADRVEGDCPSLPRRQVDRIRLENREWTLDLCRLVRGGARGSAAARLAAS